MMIKMAKMAGIGLFILSVWKITASPSIGWVDSGVIAAANTLGIPNPPGFRLARSFSACNYCPCCRGWGLYI